MAKTLSYPLKTLQELKRGRKTEVARKEKGDGNQSRRKTSRKTSGGKLRKKGTEASGIREGKMSGGTSAGLCGQQRGRVHPGKFPK